MSDHEYTQESPRHVEYEIDEAEETAQVQQTSSAFKTHSITPDEWEDFKKLTKQESIRPSQIEEPETPKQQSGPSFTFDEEYSKHFGKPFGVPEDNEKTVNLSEEETENVGYEENVHRVTEFMVLEGDISESPSESEGESEAESVDSARYNGTSYNAKFARQYSNHEELFTPPPSTVPEFPEFPKDAGLDDFAQSADFEPGNQIEDEIQQQTSTTIEASFGNDDQLIDWVNDIANLNISNFSDDFEDPNTWIALLYELMRQLGFSNEPQVDSGDYETAYQYCDWAMNELGMSERKELNLLLTADDLFGGHEILNKTVVNLIQAAFKKKLSQMPEDNSSDSSSGEELEEDSLSEAAVYDSPETTDISEEAVDFDISLRGPRPDTPEPQNQEDQELVKQQKQVKSDDIAKPSSYSAFVCLGLSLFFCLSK